MENHPQISDIYNLFKNETIPFRKIHRLIDLFETIIKTYTAIIISDYFRQKEISDEIKGFLAEGLRVPSLGTWHYFSRLIIKEMESKELEFFLPGFSSYFEKWDKKYTDKVLSFRNKYAHGATPDDDDCTADIRQFNPILEEWLKTDLLQKTRIDKSDKTDSKDKIDHVFLTRKDGKKLDLFPILCSKEIEKKGKKEGTLIFFNDLKRKKEVNYLNYPYSLHLRDKEIYEEFQRVIKTEEWKKKTTDEFKSRIEELTDIFKGRIEERKQVKEWVENHNKGYLVLFGNPGVGKSALIAQTFKELKTEKKNKIELIEYFIRRGTEYSRPSRLLVYLSKKLEERYKTGIELGNNQDEMKEKLDERLSMISEIENRNKIVIFIDGIDEGDEDKMVGYLINDTYKNIVVIYGSRKTEQVSSFYNILPLEYKWNEEIGGLKEEDIRAILYDVTDKYALTNEQVCEITKKSDGNPLYMKMLCLAIEEGDINLEEGIKLPKKIDDFYKLFIERYSKLAEADDILRSLYTFAAAKDYLTQKHLEIILGIGLATSERVITALQEVLYDNPATVEKDYQLFHESMREYIIKERKSDIREAEESLLEYCRKWEEIKDPLIRKYTLEAYSNHLLSLGEKEELYRLATNRNYQDRQIEETDQYNEGFRMIENGLKAYEGKDEKLIELGIELARLHLGVKKSLEQIKKWIMDGGEDNCNKVLKRIKNFDEKERLILYLKLLRNSTENISKETIEKILIQLDNDLTKDTSLLNLSEVIPFAYIYDVVNIINKRGISANQIFERIGELQTYEFETIIRERNSEELILLVEYVNKIEHDYEKAKVLEDISSELAIQGCLEEAIKTVEKIKENYFKSRALEAISIRLAKLGKPDEAIMIVEKIEESFEGFSVLMNVATELAKKGDSEDAFIILDKIADSTYKSIAQEKILSELLEQGKFKEVIMIAEKIEGNRYKSEALIEISSVLAEQGKQEEAKKIIEQAIQTAQYIEDSSDKSWKLKEIHSELVKQGRPEDAEKIFEKVIQTAQNIENRYHKSSALLDILSELTKQGKLIEAEKMLEQVIKITEQIEDRDAQSRIMMQLSSELVKQGKFGEGIKLVNKIEETHFKSVALKEVSIELARQGNLKEAIRTAEKIEDSSKIFQALQEVSLELAKQGKPDEAIKIAEKIEDGPDYSSTLKGISSEFARQGNLEEAIKTVEKIEDRYQKSEALKEISLELIKQGKLEDAEHIAKKITDSLNRNWALKNILYEQVKQGNSEDVYRIAKKFANDSYDKSRDLSTILIELIKRGNSEYAIKTAESIENNTIKSRALLVVSSELVKHGKPEKAKKIMGDAIETAEKIEARNIKSEMFLEISSELAKQGKPEEAERTIEKAIKTAEKIEDSSQKFSTLFEISELLARQRKFNNVEKIFEQRIKTTNKIESFDKSEELQEISLKLARQGKFKEATKTAEKIESSFQRYIRFTLIASELTKQGKIEEAIRVVEKIEDSYYKIPAQIEISSELAKRGNLKEAEKILEEAIKVVEKIEDYQNKINAQIKISAELAKQAKPEKAEKILEEAIKTSEMIEDSHDKINAQIKISAVLAKQGKLKEADKILEQIMKSIEKFEDSYAKSRIIMQLLPELAKHEKFEEARKIVNKIEEDSFDSRLTAIVILSSEIVRQGKLEEAIKIVEIIENRFEKTYTLRKISEVLSKQGKLQEAIKTAEKIEDNTDQIEALLVISSEFSKKGKLKEANKILEEAIQTAEDIKRDFEKPRVLKQISVELARLGRPEKAINTVETIEDDNSYKIKAQIEISSELAKQGKLIEAEKMLEQVIEITEQIEDSYQKSEALKEISSELAKQGKAREAEELIEESIKTAKKIEDSYEKSEALKEISSELLRKNKINESLELFNLKLSAKEYEELLTDLCKIIKIEDFESVFKFLDTAVDNRVIKISAYNILLERQVKENISSYHSKIPNFIMRIFGDMDNIGIALGWYALYLKFLKKNINTDDKKLLKKLNEVVEISNWLDWEEEVEYHYSNLSEWIDKIEDEDDRYDIEGWARRVAKSKMTEQEFEEKMMKLESIKILRNQ